MQNLEYQKIREAARQKVEQNRSLFTDAADKIDRDHTTALRY